MAAALDEYFTSGMTREQLTARFAQDFGTLTERGQRIVDREQTNPEDKAYVLDHAGGAAFLGAKQARAKFQRHRANIPSTKLKTYEADARALLVDPKTTLLLSTRVPLRNKADRPGEVALHAVFAKPMKSRKDGVAGQLVTIVDLEENVIISHHWRDDQTSQADITPAQIVKRILKWLTN